MKSVYLGSYQQANGKTGNAFWSHSFSVDAPGGPAIASMSTEEPLFPVSEDEEAPGKYAESLVGHLFELDKSKLVVSLDNDTGLQKTDKQGRLCYNLARAEMGASINMRYVGVQAPKVSIKGLPALGDL